jgi:hypothetical protein
MIRLQITKASASGLERNPEAVHWLVVSVPLGNRLNPFLVVRNRSVWAFVSPSNRERTALTAFASSLSCSAIVAGFRLPPSTSGHHSCFFFLVKKQRNLLGIGPLFELVDIDRIIRHRLMPG